MKKEEILINVILTIIVGISSNLIYKKLESDPTLTLLITFLIIAGFWLGSFIKEIDKKSDLSIKIAEENKESIKNIQKDLNTNKRLTRLEMWKENLNNKKGKKGQINIVDMLKIIALIIILILVGKALGLI